MKRFVFAFFFAACSSGGTPAADSGNGTPDATPDLSQPDVSSQDIVWPDVSSQDIVWPDVSSQDIYWPDDGWVDPTDVPDSSEPDTIPVEDNVEPTDAVADFSVPDVNAQDTPDLVEPPLPPALEFNLESHQLYFNCMPIVGPDPLLGTFTSNTLNPGTGMFDAVLGLVQVKLEVTQDQVAETFYFTVDPHVVSVPSMTGIQTVHQKVANSLLSENSTPPCQLCNGQWTLVVVADVGGEEVIRTLGPSTVECVY